MSKEYFCNKERKMNFFLLLLLMVYSLQGMELAEIHSISITSLEDFKNFATTIHGESHNDVIPSFDIVPIVINQAAKDILGIAHDCGWEDDYWNALKQSNKQEYDQWTAFFLQYFSQHDDLKETDIFAQNSKNALLSMKKKSEAVQKEKGEKVKIACVNFLSGGIFGVLIAGVYILKMASLSCEQR
jgi:hypothetical protein